MKLGAFEDMPHENTTKGVKSELTGVSFTTTSV